MNKFLRIAFNYRAFPDIGEFAFFLYRYNPQHFSAPNNLFRHAGFGNPIEYLVYILS
jgi:hypothetical protein